MVLTCDIGTTLLKTAIIDTKGNLNAFSNKRFLALHVENQNDTHSMHRQWMKGLEESILSLPGMKREQIRAVVISGNGPTLVPVGEKGVPLSPVLTWQNTHGEEYSEVIKQKTGNTVEPSYYLGKIYWLFRNMPQIYEKVRYFLPCPEYINFYLTGNARIILPAQDYTRYIWSSHAIESLGMDSERSCFCRRPGFHHVSYWHSNGTRGTNM
jgi:xylulokinase